MQDIYFLVLQNFLQSRFLDLRFHNWKYDLDSVEIRTVRRIENIGNGEFVKALACNITSVSAQIIHVNAYVVEEIFLPQFVEIYFEFCNIHRNWKAHDKINAPFFWNSIDRRHRLSLKLFEVQLVREIFMTPFVHLHGTFCDHHFVEINYSEASRFIII